jgi:hypothetical protein
MRGAFNPESRRSDRTAWSPAATLFAGICFASPTLQTGSRVGGPLAPPFRIALETHDQNGATTRRSTSCPSLLLLCKFANSVVLKRIYVSRPNVSFDHAARVLHESSNQEISFSENCTVLSPVAALITSNVFYPNPSPGEKKYSVLIS